MPASQAIVDTPSCSAEAALDVFVNFLPTMKHGFVYRAFLTGVRNDGGLAELNAVGVAEDAWRCFG